MDLSEALVAFDITAAYTHMHRPGSQFVAFSLPTTVSIVPCSITVSNRLLYFSPPPLPICCFKLFPSLLFSTLFQLYIPPHAGHTREEFLHHVLMPALNK